MKVDFLSVNEYFIKMGLIVIWFLEMKYDFE